MIDRNGQNLEPGDFDRIIGGEGVGKIVKILQFNVKNKNYIPVNLSLECNGSFKQFLKFTKNLEKVSEDEAMLYFLEN